MWNKPDVESLSAERGGGGGGHISAVKCLGTLVTCRQYERKTIIMTAGPFVVCHLSELSFDKNMTPICSSETVKSRSC